MSDFYEYFEVEGYEEPVIEDHFVGGTSIFFIGVLSFVVIVIIILAIHIFSKKLDELDCQVIQNTERIEEMEPLPVYQEREIPTEAEVNLSNYVQFSDTINTIPRDTMNIINRLNESSNGYTRLINDNQVNGENTENNENQGEEPQPTSTIPVPLPEKASMPRIPPPCYDVALTQPRINNKGLIVLPQDPSFSILPFFSRSTAVHRNSIRRNRPRSGLFSFHLHRSNSNSSSTNHTPNNYRYQEPQITSSLSTSSNTSSDSAISESNTALTQHHRNSSVHDSRIRSFLRHRHHSNTFRRHRRRRLRAHRSSDNISVSSISVYYPTSVMDIPEDHYSIETHAYSSVRNYHSHSFSSVGRNLPTNATTINGSHDPELSQSTQHLLSTISEYGSSSIQQSQPYQNSTLAVLHDNESWIDIPPPTPIMEYEENNKNVPIASHADSAISVESDQDNIASTSQNSQDNIIINVQSNNHQDSNQITIHSNFDPVNNLSYQHTNEQDSVINVITY